MDAGIPHPAGPTSHDHSDDKRALVYITIFTFGTAAIVLTLLRLYIRTWVLRAAWWDDYTALAAAVRSEPSRASTFPQY